MLDLIHKLMHDQRLTSNHVSLFLAVLGEQGFSEQPIEVCWEELMQMGKIRTKDKYFEGEVEPAA